MSGVPYQPRLVDAVLEEVVTELPAVLLTGPRATGKTTTALQHAASVVRLDKPAEAATFRADPDVALAAYTEPVLLDEWQEVPAVLAAVKRAVDADPRPGRFLLTGSVAATLDSAMWPGTGRLVHLKMYGMTVREQLGRLDGLPFLERLARGQRLSLPPNPPDLRGYVDLALAGGFPDPVLRLGGSARARWLDSYVEQLVTRDVAGAESRRDPGRLRRYLEAYALNSAGVVADTTLIEAAGLNRKTAVAYEGLLENLFIVERVHGWTSNRLKRLAVSPKRYLVDAGLAAAILRLDTVSVLRDGNLLGRVLDTFVASQLRAELVASKAGPRLHHIREEHGRYEIDLVAEMAADTVLAIEVKATSAPGPDDARHLSWLRERIGDRFLHGVVFHTGPHLFELGDRITAAPICTLWA